MIYRQDPRYYPEPCKRCGKPEGALNHGPLGECYALRRADYEPWSMAAWRREDQAMKDATR